MECRAPDFVRTGPGTLAGRYLRMFWQPVYRSQDLERGAAIPLRALGESFTLYRGESGAAHLLAFRCAHRGSQLSTGWVEGDCVRCRYHGWKYDSTGQCVEQPGEDGSFAEKVKIQSYPTREYLGLVFAYLGDGQPHPFRKFPDFDKDGLILNDYPETWPCNYFNRLENDPAHVAFTHRESALRTGSKARLHMPRTFAMETEYGIRKEQHTPGQPVQYIHVHMPNVLQLRARLGRGNVEKDAAPIWQDRLFFTLPIDDENCVRFGVFLVHVSGGAAERYRQRANQLNSERAGQLKHLGDQILAGKMAVEDLDRDHSIWELFWIEDYITEVGQGAIADRTNEHLGRIDPDVILQRKIWERELFSLAEGRPLKQWTIPAGLGDMVSIKSAR